jgi:hypothetical protein
MIDPAAAITTISLGLGLVDQFRELVLSFRGESPRKPGTTVERSGDSLQVTTDGHVDQEVHAQDLALDFWDQTRYRALENRVQQAWVLYNEYYAQSAVLSVSERAVVNTQMKTTVDGLCKDFREMVSIYERAMGMSLPDHYQLGEVCGPRS